LQIPNKRISYRTFVPIAVILFICMVLFVAVGQLFNSDLAFLLALMTCILLLFMIYLTEFPSEKVERLTKYIDFW